MSEREYWLGFSVFPGIGPNRFALLLSHFGSAEKAWNAQELDLLPVLKPALTAAFLDFRETFPFKGYLAELERKEVEFIILNEPEYPILLKQIKRPPLILFVKGNKEILNPAQDDNEKTIAVVGTRKITQYGREVTELFTQELVMQGFTIVSGMALGVDAVAHKTTLDNNGRTIAVLGCGVDCPLPIENTNLYREILKKGGVIVSEYPLNHPPTKGSFPARNRIIAGLSQGVLVTEGAEDSGSLITADYGLQFDRPVFAIPGPVTSSLSRGPLTLIKKGGKMVTTAEEIVKELNVQFSNSKLQSHSKSQFSKNKKGNKDELKILEILENESLHFDQIARKTGIQSSKLGGILSLMEIKGVVKSTGGTFSIAS